MKASLWKSLKFKPIQIYLTSLEVTNTKPKKNGLEGTSAPLKFKSPEKSQMIFDLI